MRRHNNGSASLSRRHWGALYALASTVARSLEMDQVLRVGLAQALETLGVEAGWIHLRQESGQLVMALSQGLSQKALEKIQRLAVGQGLVRQVAERGQPAVAEAAALDPRLSSTLRQEGFRGLLALPLKAQGEVLGVLGVAQRRVQHPKDFTFLEAVGNTLGQAVKNALLHQQVRQMAFTDVLTGLPNARYIGEEIRREITRARRSQASFSVAMVDLDSLKGVNDRFGHAVGDRLLQDIASLLRSAIRASDTAARYGGDEFLVLLLGADSATAAQISQRISAAVANYRLRVEEAAIPVRVSLGLASYPEDASTVEELLRRADEAMYRSKRAGGSP